MPEFPIILTHNVLDGAELTADDIPAHEIDYLRDGHRHTWWQAPATTLQNITARAANSVVNPDFEIDDSGWNFIASGGGAGSFARNTTAPIVGNGDALLIATTANDTGQLVAVFQFEPIFMKANRTYRIMIRALVQDGVQKNIRLGFLQADLTEDASCYDVIAVQTTDNGHHVDITPTDDGWFHPYIRALEPQTLQFDDVVVGEVRNVDTLIIDAGHNLILAGIDVDYRPNEKVGWSNVANPSTTQWQTKGPVYITFDGQMALSWRVNITVWPLYAGVEVAKVPLLYLGKRWTLPHHFSGSFDPQQKERFDDMTVGDRGVAQRSLKWNARRFKASLSAIDDTNNLDLDKFFEDTDNGAKPFFFAWKPDSNINDILCMRLEGAKNVPYQNGAQRRWEPDFIELAGRRET